MTYLTHLERIPTLSRAAESFELPATSDQRELGGAKYGREGNT